MNSWLGEVCKTVGTGFENDLALFEDLMRAIQILHINMKSSDAKASKCHLNFSSKMTIFIKLVYLSSIISLK